MYAKKKIGVPSRKEGREGDVLFRKDFGGKSSIFGKIGGIWEKIGLDVVSYPTSGSLALFKDINRIYHSNKFIFKNNTLDFYSTLKLGKIDAATSDTDKFLVSDGGTIKYRTGSEILSDIGAGEGVSITTDSGSGSPASDVTGVASFSLLGNNGVGITNSGTTITAVAVPAEIDHDSLNNFASNEHYTQGNIVETGALNAGSITSGFGNIDTGSSTIDTTGAVSTGALTCTTINTGQGANEVYDMDQNVKTDSSVTFADVSGAPIWQYLPFHIQTGTNGRHYYVDNDGYSDSARKWDSYDTDPTGFNYRSVAGQFIVPENCTLVAMYGVIANQSSTNNPTVTIYTSVDQAGGINEANADTTLTSAGSVTVTVTTLRVPYKFNKTDFDVDLDAGDIIVPTISHDDSGGTRTFTGALTLKFITR